MGCVDSIKLNQKLVQNFVKIFSKAPKGYDIYHLGIWFRKLSYSMTQTFPTNPYLLKKSRSISFNEPFQNNILYKILKRQKEAEDFLTLRFLVPAWKSSFPKKFGVILASWFFKLFNNRVTYHLSSIFSSLFDSLSNIYKVQIINELYVSIDWWKKFNLAKVTKNTWKSLNLLFMTSDIENKSTFLIKKKLPSKAFLSGYSARFAGSLQKGFNLNSLINSELKEKFVTEEYLFCG